MNTLFIDVQVLKKKNKINDKIHDKTNAKKSEMNTKKSNDSKSIIEIESDRKNRIKNKIYEKKDIGMYNLLKYKLDFDILSHGDFYNNINLKIDLKLLNKFAKSNSKKSLNISRKVFETIIKTKLGNIDTLNLVFSKNLDKKENENCKRYILQVLSSIKGITLKEIVISNKMSINDIKYINEYVKKENINPNKLKILVAIDDITDYSNNKMIEYISNYKYVDILKMSGIDKIRYKNLSENIDKINNEFGSTIEITQKRNIQEYDVCLMYSKVNHEDFKSHYILRNKSKVIDMHDEEQDKLNDNIKAYEKNKEYIETLFNRIDVDLASYSKNKLGALMLEEKDLTLDK